jgi:hypothetical protein
MPNTAEYTRVVISHGVSSQNNSDINIKNYDNESNEGLLYHNSGFGCGMCNIIFITKMHSRSDFDFSTIEFNNSLMVAPNANKSPSNSKVYHSCILMCSYEEIVPDIVIDPFKAYTDILSVRDTVYNYESVDNFLKRVNVIQNNIFSIPIYTLLTPKTTRCVNMDGSSYNKYICDSMISENIFKKEVSQKIPLNSWLYLIHWANLSDFCRTGYQSGSVNEYIPFWASLNTSISLSRGVEVII